MGLTITAISTPLLKGAAFAASGPSLSNSRLTGLSGFPTHSSPMLKSVPGESRAYASKLFAGLNAWGPLVLKRALENATRLEQIIELGVKLEFVSDDEAGSVWSEIQSLVNGMDTNVLLEKLSEQKEYLQKEYLDEKIRLSPSAYGDRLYRDAVKMEGDFNAFRGLLHVVIELTGRSNLGEIIEFLEFNRRMLYWFGSGEGTSDEKIADMIATLSNNLFDAQAARYLGGVRDVRAVQPLIEALGSRDDAVRKEATASLQRIEFKEIGNDLFYLRETVSTAIRTFYSHHELAARKAIATVLAKMLGHSSEIFDDLRELSRVLPPDQQWLVRRAMVKEAAKRGEEGAKSLIMALEDEKSEVSSAAMEALAEMGAPAVKYLVRAIEGDNEAIRGAVSDILAFMRDPDAIEPLLEALENGYAVREVALAFGDIGDHRTVEPLINVLKTGGTEYDRPAAVWALGNIGDPRAIEPLTKLLEDEDLDSDLRENVEDALRKIRAALSRNQ